MKAASILLAGAVLLAPATVLRLQAQRTQPPDQKVEPKAPAFLLEINNELKETDAKDAEFNTPSKKFTVKFVKDKTYVIELKSKAFDAYLRLLDKNGKQLAKDDDSGGGLDSLIRHTATETAEHQLVAIALDGQPGKFTLKVRELPGQDKKVDEVKKPTLEKPTEFVGKLTESDPKTTVQEGNLKAESPHKVHVMKLLAGKGYEIELTHKDKSMDPYLRVEDSTGKVLATDDDSGGDKNAKLVFHPEKTGDFRLVATCWYGTGDYVLRVTQVEVPNIVKGVAGKVYDVGNAGLTINNNLANNDPLDKRRPGCFAKVFQVKMFKGKTYTIDMVSNQIDSYLRIETMAGNQLAEDDDGGGFPNARIVFQPTENAVYRIIGTSFANNSVGAFTITVRE